MIAQGACHKCYNNRQNVPDAAVPSMVFIVVVAVVMVVVLVVVVMVVLVVIVVVDVVLIGLDSLLAPSTEKRIYLHNRQFLNETSFCHNYATYQIYANNREAFYINFDSV